MGDRRRNRSAPCKGTFKCPFTEAVLRERGGTVELTCPEVLIWTSFKRVSSQTGVSLAGLLGEVLKSVS